MEAVAAGRSEVARLLMQLGADVTAVDVDNGTALHIAAGCGLVGLIESLIESGADVNGKGHTLAHSFSRARTGLMRAFPRSESSKERTSTAGRPSMTPQWQIRQTPPASSSSKVGSAALKARPPPGPPRSPCTAPELATTLSFRMAFHRFMRRAGALVDAEDIEGSTPLLSCSTPNMASLLLDNGAEARVRSSVQQCAGGPCRALLVPRPWPCCSARRGAESPENRKKGFLCGLPDSSAGECCSAGNGRDAPPFRGLQLQSGAGAAAPGARSGYPCGGQGLADAPGRFPRVLGAGTAWVCLSRENAAGGVSTRGHGAKNHRTRLAGDGGRSLHLGPLAPHKKGAY